MSATETRPQVIWRDPPNPRRHRDAFAGVFGELASRPGQWALIRTYNHASSCASAATGLRKRYPGFELRGAGTDLYARYLNAEA